MRWPAIPRRSPPASADRPSATATRRRWPGSGAMPTPPPSSSWCSRPAGWRHPPPTFAPARWCATGRWSRGGRSWWRSRSAYPRDTTAASSALFLLGDLASDDQADRLARTYYRRAALRYPDQPVRGGRPLPRGHGRATHRRRGDGRPRVRRAGPPVFPERRGCGIGVLGRAGLVPRGRQREGARPLAEGDSGRSDILLRQPCRPAAGSAGVGAAAGGGQLHARARRRLRRAPRLAAGAARA